MIIFLRRVCYDSSLRFLVETYYVIWILRLWVERFVHFNANEFTFSSLVKKFRVSNLRDSCFIILYHPYRSFPSLWLALNLDLLSLESMGNVKCDLYCIRWACLHFHPWLHFENSEILLFSSWMHWAPVTMDLRLHINYFFFFRKQVLSANIVVFIAVKISFCYIFSSKKKDFFHCQCSYCTIKICKHKMLSLSHVYQDLPFHLNCIQKRERKKNPENVLMFLMDDFVYVHTIRLQPVNVTYIGWMHNVNSNLYIAASSIWAPKRQI